MKKTLALLVAAVALGAGAVVAWADAPIVIVDPIGSIGPLDPADLPYTYEVTGTVRHESGPSCGENDLNPVNDVNLYIDGTLVDTQTIPDNLPSCDFLYSLDWVITGAGTYVVKVTAKHGDCPTCTGSDQETVEVTILEGPVVVTECPAAPAIAAHYLKSSGVKAGSKQYTNTISLVAQHMGPQTDFNDVGACDAGYATVVRAFVDASLAAPTPKK